MDLHITLLVIGALLLVGLAADEVGQRTRLPRVTLLILFGVAAGPSGLELLPKAFSNSYDFLATVALTMVAFLLGGTLSTAMLRRHGKEILTVSLSVVFVTAIIVTAGLLALGTTAPLALLLAGIANRDGTGGQFRTPSARFVQTDHSRKRFSASWPWMMPGALSSSVSCWLRQRP